MDEIKEIEVFKKGDFSRWLEENGIKEKRVRVIIHKKHTGKSEVNAASLMREAICFGWIDTTAHRLDHDRFMINYAKRTEKSRWSHNTIRYGKELIKEGKMSAEGLKFFKMGLAKPVHDLGIPKNPDMPKELRVHLNKDKMAKINFNNFSPSYKKMVYRVILRAKLPETKKKRIESVVTAARSNKKIL